jgi:hypothetical protein
MGDDGVFGRLVMIIAATLLHMVIVCSNINLVNAEPTTVTVTVGLFGHDGPSCGNGTKEWACLTMRAALDSAFAHSQSHFDTAIIVNVEPGLYKVTYLPSVEGVVGGGEARRGEERGEAVINKLNHFFVVVLE